MRTFITMILCLLLVSITVQGQNKNNNKNNNEERSLSVGSKSFTHKARTGFNLKASNNCSPSPYRTIDGSCNNVSDTSKCFWGASDIQLRRALPAQYSSSDPFNAMAGENRLSPRAISNLICDQAASIESAVNLSSFVFTWGQFIDHDIDLTPETDDESEPVLLPADEPLFIMDIPFHRAEPLPNTGITSPRQHPNIITSWIDASNVYGSEITRADWLRTNVDGKLKTSTGNLLPYNTIDGELGSAIDPNAPSMAGDNQGTYKLFVAGDVRASEQPGLTTLHTLFVREHNRICDELAAGGMTGDQLIYETARKRVGALLQKITYSEFLPAFGVDISPYSGYNSTIQPDISSVFSTAAYRLGHTMVTEELLLVGDDCMNVAGGSLALLDGFFEPTHVQNLGIEPFLKGLSVQVQQEIDTKIISNLRNFLFGNDPDASVAFGLDLASLNIQRGRDHGLPDYNTVRTHFLGQGVQSFSDITSDPALQIALATAYTDVNDIDPWVGMLAEDQMPNSSIGATLNAILKDQFERLRDGDAFYYENDTELTNEVANINNTTLSDIIQRNTNLTTLQSNVFFAQDCTCPLAEGMPCDDGNQNTLNDIMDDACNCIGTMDSVAVQLRAYLSGAMLNSAASNLMQDDLRINDHLPMAEPYTSLNTFTHIGDGGGETMNPLLLIPSGADGIVDWVLIEIRDAVDPTIILQTQAAMLKCNGDIITQNGESALKFPLLQEYYHVSIKHRNHLGIMTKNPVYLETNSVPLVDFSDPITPTWGTDGQFELTNGKMAMWGGDTNGDKKLVFQGTTNDVNSVFFGVLNDPDNVNNLTNYIREGYHVEDVDLNGQMIYQGGNNENNFMFFSIMAHPQNVLQINNYIIEEQLP